MARMVWADQTLNNTSTDLTPLEPNIASLGINSLSAKQTLAKDEIAGLLRLRLAEYKGLKNPVEEGSDGSTTAAGTTFNAAGAAFTTKKVNTAHRLWITSGDDKGVYTFTAIASNTQLTGCSPAFAATASGLSYYIEGDVLDLIKNPAILKRPAVYLTLHYCALELVQQVGDFWDQRQELYRKRFEEAFAQHAPDLLIDTSQDDVISQSERKMGITGGRFLR